MSWAYAHGDLYVVWFPGALLACGVAVGLLLLMRRASLRTLDNAGEFPCKARYLRGARWGWLVSVAFFLCFVLYSSIWWHQRLWQADMLAFIWFWALAMTYLFGAFFPHELTGWLALVAAAWQGVRRKQFDWTGWATRIEEELSRWWYGPLLCVPTAAFMAFFSWNMLTVLTWGGHAHVHRIIEIRNEADASIKRVDATPYQGWDPPRIWVQVSDHVAAEELPDIGDSVGKVLASHAGRELDYLIEIYVEDGPSFRFRYDGDRRSEYLDVLEGGM